MNAWFDNRTKEEVLNSTIFDLVQKTIGTPGLVGLDKLLSFMIVKELQVRERYFFTIFWGKIFILDIVTRATSNGDIPSKDFITIPQLSF